MRNRLGVVVADDKTRSRRGLRALLTTCPALQVIGEAADGQGALELVAAEHPDVVVMDARMPGVDGMAATRAIKQQWPEVRVIILTMYDGLRADASRAGADAFLVKGCSLDVLLGAILGE